LKAFKRTKNGVLAGRLSNSENEGSRSGTNTTNKRKRESQIK